MPTYPTKQKLGIREDQEFGKAPAGVTVCPVCKCAFYKKSWHAPLASPPDQEVRTKLCPADEMKKEKRFEGQVVIVVSRPETLQDIRNAIRNSDRQAQDHDPMDRVLWIDEEGNTLKVYTSENQMAVRLGKKLKDSHPGSTLAISHGEDQDPFRVTWKQ